MTRTSLIIAALALVFSGAGQANATTVTDDISGAFYQGANSYTFSGNITLDVVGGQAISGTGEITILGLADVPMVLITPSTPGNETSPGPVGYRANDGTDFGGLDTAIPINTIGLLFDVDTTTAEFGQFPLLNLASGIDNSTFTGEVGGTEYYDLSGTASITATPLPSTWLMLLGGLVGLGFFAYSGTQKHSLAAA
jgi:hypothetical protein